MTDRIKLLLTSASGVEKVLKSELTRMGYPELPSINGEVELDGTLYDIARLNINLRTCDRVYLKLAEFGATTFDEIFENTLKINWGDYLPKNARIIVNGNCVKSKIFAISACQKIIKKAIVVNMQKRYNISHLSENGALFEVEFKLFKDTLKILLNTSGAGLHKRGYRDLVGIAPIKETLASSLILLSDYYYERPLADPFCGSGTILIEGAKIGLNIAPNKDRKFAFNEWGFYDNKLYKTALEEAIDNEKRERKIEVFGSDIDDKAVKLAKHHIERAGLNGIIKVKKSDVKDFSSELKNGTIISNPPYGERVYDKKEAEECYKSLGQAFNKLDNWSAFVITSANNFERYFGKKADRERKLYNSNKECKLYYYYKDKGRF